MEELKNLLKHLQDLIDKILRDYLKTQPLTSNIIGTFSDDETVYLVERMSNGKEYLIPSKDGINFDAENKILISKYGGNPYFFIPVELKNWNHPARNNVNPRGHKFDHANVTILGEFDTKKGMLALYDVSYITTGHQRLLGGGLVCSKNAPSNIIWRSEDPLWDEFIKDDEVKYKPLGATEFKEYLYIYYYRDNEIYSIKIKDPFKKITVEIARTQIRKYINNPVLAPNPNNHWESMAAFNPAAIAHEGKIHLFYRAQGHDHLSVVGYAYSEDGYSFERIDQPAYIPDQSFTKVVRGLMAPDPKRVSGYGWGGCEDPRATLIDNVVHLIYVAFDGWSEPRLAMSTIHIDDVIRQDWDKWSDPKFLTPWSNVWGSGNKSGVLFPRKIKDRYVILHRLWPNICVDYVEDLDFGDNKKYLQTRGQIKVRKDYWDSQKIGAGAPPIEIDEGWLLIYFGVGYQDSGKYKIGAMILDKDDPEKILYRSSTPIIAPEEWYENGGKPGVAYPCGAVVKDEELIIYYGGGDAVVCVASCKLNEFVKELKKDAVDPELLKSVYVHD